MRKKNWLSRPKGTSFHTVSERLCVKIVSIRLKRDLIGYAPFLLSDLVKRSQTTLHTASERARQVRAGDEAAQ